MKKIIAGLVVLVLGTGMSAAAGLDVSLSGPLAKNDYGSGKIAYALTNSSGTTLHVLRRQTPLGGLTGKLFDVTKNGVKVDYVGPIYLYLPPTAADYVELKPGETLATEIDLTAYYDMKGGGQFEVRYARDARDVVKEAGEAAKAGVTAGYLDFDRKGAASIWVDAAVDALDVSENASYRGDAGFKAGAGVLAASNTFEMCTTTQKAEIASARIVATNYARDAKAYMDAGKHGSRYTASFGGYNENKYKTIKGKFQKIYTKLSSKSMIFNCGCNGSDAVAYVINSAPQIFLCSPFWEMGIEGYYAKAGVLVHETSHLKDGGNTDDVNPLWNNAYSYHGFAVNEARLD